MNIFEDSINLLKGAAFTNIQVNDSYLYLESPAIFSEYIVPLTYLDKFDSQSAHDLFLNLQENDKNISYYIRQTLVDEYRDYFKRLKLSEDYVDSYMVKEVIEPIEFDSNGTLLVEVEEDFFEDYKYTALEIFNNWANEEDYVNYFNQLSKEHTKDFTKVFKDYVLTLNNTIVSIGSTIYDIEMNLAYIHNAGTVSDYRRNGYFNILNNLIINEAVRMGINRIYSITEQGSESYNAYKKLGFKEEDVYYSFS